MKYKINTTHRVGYGLIVPNIAHDKLNALIRLFAPHFILFFFISAKKNADFFKSKILQSRQHSVTKGSGPTSNQQGLSLKRFRRINQIYIHTFSYTNLPNYGDNN